MHSIIIISAPSGGGKTSLTKELVASNKNLVASISYTTRAKRKNEVDGVDYFFVSNKVFTEMIRNDEFVEYAKVFDNYYGTSKTLLTNTLQKKDVIVKIDWQGARQIKNIFSDVVSIFILPKNIKVLQQRLKLRGDDALLIKHRMQEASCQMDYAKEYDYQIVNDNFNDTLTKIRNIIS